MIRSVLALLLCSSALCVAQQPRTHATTPPAAFPHYIASWTASAQAPEPQNNQPGVDPGLLTDVTIRQIVHLSATGIGLRIHLSNVFGKQPLVVDDVHIALAAKPDSSATIPGTDQLVAFGGHTSVTIPVGAEFLSDPAYLPASGPVTPPSPKPGSDLAISFHLPQPPSGQTGHPLSLATSYLLHGDHAADPELPGASRQDRWFQLTEVDANAPPDAQTVVAFGDSITDGYRSSTNANTRWPDELARRLREVGRNEIAVANQGISGNHLLTDGLGENALQRLDRDVLALPAVRNLIVLEGINDIGMLAHGTTATPQQHAELVFRMEAAYTQIIERAHAHGIRVIGGTLTPFVDSDFYKPTAANEADRVAVNGWIRQAGPGHFDAVIDFDKAVRDPAHPDRMQPALDSGDHLHPGSAGYKVMGQAIPLNLFSLR